MPHTGDGDRDGLLVRAARPVLSSLTDDLASTNVGLLLTGRDGDILDRWVPERSLGSRFDRVHLAPGFVYTEPAVGTNAIGTAIAARQPSFVRGSEHFADALTALACAAAPIMDPRTGHVLGVIDLTCSARDASPLMLALARRAAREIEERLVDDAAIAERVMMRQFLRKRRGSKHPMVFANQRIVLTNTAAEGLVKAEDEPLLRRKAEEMMATAALRRARSCPDQRHARRDAVRADPRWRCRARRRDASRRRIRSAQPPAARSREVSPTQNARSRTSSPRV